MDAFPLQYNNCELMQEEQEFQPEFLINILDRLDWQAVLRVAHNFGNDSLPQALPENIDIEDEGTLALLKDLHTLLLETCITEGEMKCLGCEHIYYIKNSIPNFLLPPHLA
jgi:multifunctional methyltransferase subunit TRM112